jgi:hypothetical protein
MNKFIAKMRIFDAHLCILSSTTHIYILYFTVRTKKEKRDTLYDRKTRNVHHANEYQYVRPPNR